MSDSNQSEVNARKPHASNGSRQRYDGFSNLFGPAPYYPVTPPPFQSNNRLYHNMTRYWHRNDAFDDNEGMYNSSGIASTIIDRPSDDCFSNGVKITGDDDELMANEFDRLSVLNTFADAIRWARLFGASAILIIAQDGGTLDQPLNFDNIDSIEDLKVYDLRYIKPTDILYTDATDPKYGLPEIFGIYPPGAPKFDVHETRLIPFSGDPLPKGINVKQTVWWIGNPVLNHCKHSIERLERALMWSEKLLERKQQGIYGMQGLGELFAQQMDDIVAKRINLVDMVRGNLNSVVVDAEDKFTIENLGLDGLQQLISEYQISICADARFPSVILFGKSATSLNTTGAGELEQYYGMIDLLRTRVARPALEQLVALLWLQRSLEGEIPDQWSVEFLPLWKPSAKEQADTDLVANQAKSAEVSMLVTLMDAGILMPEEVRKIVINKYSEYGFPDAMTSNTGNEGYAQSVAGDDAPGDNENGIGAS